jgi:hypothetical protein
VCVHRIQRLGDVAEPDDVVLGKRGVMPPVASMPEGSNPREAGRFLEWNK